MDNAMIQKATNRTSKVSIQDTIENYAESFVYNSTFLSLGEEEKIKRIRAFFDMYSEEVGRIFNSMEKYDDDYIVSQMKFSYDMVNDTSNKKAHINNMVLAWNSVDNVENYNSFYRMEKVDTGSVIDNNHNNYNNDYVLNMKTMDNVDRSEQLILDVTNQKPTSARFGMKANSLDKMKSVETINSDISALSVALSLVGLPVNYDSNIIYSNLKRQSSKKEIIDAYLGIDKIGNLDEETKALMRHELIKQRGKKNENDFFEYVRVQLAKALREFYENQMIKIKNDKSSVNEELKKADMLEKYMKTMGIEPVVHTDSLETPELNKFIAIFDL